LQDCLLLGPLDGTYIERTALGTGRSVKIVSDGDVDGSVDRETISPRSHESGAARIDGIFEPWINAAAAAVRRLAQIGAAWGVTVVVVDNRIGAGNRDELRAPSIGMEQGQIVVRNHFSVRRARNYEQLRGAVVAIDELRVLVDVDVTTCTRQRVMLNANGATNLMKDVVTDHHIVAVDAQTVLNGSLAVVGNVHVALPNHVP